MQIHMQKAIILATILLNLIASPLAVGADENQERRHRGPDRFEKIIALSGLNLTAEQKTKIADLRTAHLKDIKPLEDKMHSRRGDLRLLWLEKSPDEAKIRATEKEVRALRDQIDDKKTDYRWAVYKVLTPEQQELLKQNRTIGRCFGPGPGAGKGMGPGRGPGMGPGTGPRMGAGMGGGMR